VTLRGVTAIGAGTGVLANAFTAADNTAIDARNVIASGTTADVSSFTDSSGATATVTLDNSNYDTRSEMGTNASVTNPGTASNQTSAPVFANVGSGDFHQLAGSPTRNAGSAAASLIGSLDLDREPRNQESAPDIGADEYDVIPPETQITSGAPAVTSDPTPTFTFSSDDPLSSFMCALDGGAFAFGACSGPGASHTAATLADGPHTFRVEAVDVSSNVDPTPALQGFTVDTRQPETRIDKGPARKGASRVATFKVSSDEPGASFECLLDRASFKPCGANTTYRKLRRGKHSFQVRSRDAAGNIDATPAVRTWRVTKRRH